MRGWVKVRGREAESDERNREREREREKTRIKKLINLLQFMLISF